MFEDFNRIYEEYYVKIYRNILYFTGDTHAAEDIAQEVFIKLYKSPPLHSNIIGWLTKVSTNLSFNYLRNKKQRNDKEISEPVEEVGNIEESVMKNFEMQLVKKALNHLPDRDKMCLLLKFSGYKYDEIAKVVQINKGSVGTILARAQEKFKEAYFKESEGDH